MKNITKIVLSGGPCGGKTKALNFLIQELAKLNFDVFPITESACNVLEAGFDRTNSFEFQKEIALNQIKMEEEAKKKAQNANNPVIICDRGLMDCRVYLNDLEYAKIKEFLHMSDIDLRDRYDAVFHLDSTSHSNLFYKKTDNRTENSQEAKILNKKSLKAWCGNSHYRFIPVCKAFNKKAEILLNEVKGFLGVPYPLEIERKFLIKYPDTKKLLNKCCNVVEIEQWYLTNDEGRFRLRKRGNKGNFIYIKTIKNKITDTIREEIEEQLTEKEFTDLLSSSQIQGNIKKDRYCLMENQKYFEIDVFPFWQKQAYLEIELLNENERFEIPNYIEVIEEVTYKPEYKNSRLCKHIPPEK